MVKFSAIGRRASAGGLVGLALVAAVALVVVSAGSSAHHRRASLRLAAAAAAPVVTAPTAAQTSSAAATFGVFGQQAQAADSLPAESAYKVGTARRVGPSSGAVAAWAVVTGEQVCVTVNAGTGPAAGGPAACNSPTELAQPNQLLILDAGSSDSSSHVIAGLVPDGVSSVTIDLGSAAPVSVPVTSNGFTYTTPAGELPSGYSWTANGKTSTEKVG